jgi:hypothetical protein
MEPKSRWRLLLRPLRDDRRLFCARRPVAPGGAGVYLCRDVTHRRIISLVITVTLLVALLAPPATGARSCGSATRVVSEQAAPKKGHGCSSCSKKRSPQRVAPPLRALERVDVGDGGRPMLCCHDGGGSRRASIDVPTLTAPPSQSPLMVLRACLPHFDTGRPSGSRVDATRTIGESPPHLARLLRDTYLHTSVFRI